MPDCRSAETNGKLRRTVSQEAQLVETHEVVLDALGDRTRRAILERLRDGPKPVVEIARDLPVGRPAVSQHLKVLKQAGLVSDRAVGTRRVYEVDREGLEAAQRYLGSFWSDALSRFRRAAEKDHSPRRQQGTSDLRR
jgi:DNA-binding transcriptional ArsR family regulator